MRLLANQILLAALFAALFVLNAQAQEFLKPKAKTIEEVWSSISYDQEYLLKNPTGSASFANRALDSIRREFRAVDGSTGLKILAGLRKPEAKDRDYLDEAHTEVAKKLVVENKQEECGAIIELMRRTYQTPAARCETMLVAAQLAAARGETKAEKESLDDCLAVDAPDSPSRDRSRIWSAKNEAVVRLAMWHEKYGNCILAFHYHKAHKFEGGCGISACFFDNGRVESLSRCITAISDHRIAVRLCLNDAMTDSGEVARRFLFPLYRDSGQLADLWQIANDLEHCDAEKKRASADEKRPHDTVSSLLRASIAGEQMRQEGDIAGLAAKFANGGRTKGLQEQVAAMLVDCAGDKQSVWMPLLVSASPRERNILLTSLANKGSPASLRVIIQFAETDTYCEGDYIPFTDSDFLMADYIAEGGPEGIKALSRLARHADSKRASAAENQLRFLNVAGRAAFEAEAANRSKERKSTTAFRHKPAPGSLPRCLDEALAIEVPAASSPIATGHRMIAE